MLAKAEDPFGRFREIVCDPINLFIRRCERAGVVENGLVYLHNDLRVPFGGPQAYYGDFSWILAINRGVHEPLEEFIFQELIGHLPRAPLMIELGAYWGHYSMWLKHERPDGSVIMVEPVAEHLEVGKRNFQLNNFTGEFIHDFVGAGKFGVDAFLAQRRIEKLDILHCDIQGFELEMLADCRQSLARKAIDYLFVSTHTQRKHYEVLEQLEDHGYRLEVSSDFDHGTTSNDGLIFVASPDVKPVLPKFVPIARTEIVTAQPARLVDYVQHVSQCRK